MTYLEKAMIDEELVEFIEDLTKGISMLNHDLSRALRNIHQRLRKLEKTEDT